MYKNKQGFTLMELMVVMAIVAILLSIAIPNYQRSVVRSNRAAAQAEMMQISALLEQYKARQFGYTGANFLALGRSTTAVTTINFPTTGSANYTLTIVPAASTWTLTATPVGRQLAANDGMMALDNLGRQCWNPSSNIACDLTNTSLAWSVSR